MSHNPTEYEVEAHVAELYDQIEDYIDDVELIREQIGPGGPLRILEPFCGTGRILIPLALDGHTLVGLDKAISMLTRARLKIADLPGEAINSITLHQADVLTDPWPQGFDLVILGGNCFYELATPEEQEHCITCAARSLEPGGYVYVDNNHMEGDLDESWQQPGVYTAYLTGSCADGTSIDGTIEIAWFDVKRRLVRFRRHTKVALPDGQIVEKEFVQQKHPVSAVEVHTWLEAHGFVVEQMYGDRAGNPYTEASKRAIFWARKSDYRYQSK